MKRTFSQADAYGLHDSLICSAILFLYEQQAAAGLGKIGGLYGWRPIPASYRQNPGPHPSRPCLRLV